MSNFKFFTLLTLSLLGGGFLFSLHQGQTMEINNLFSVVSELKIQVNALQTQLQRQAKKPRPTFVVQGVHPNSASLKDQVFRYLYLMNGKASSEDASIPKKIRYIPHQLIIQNLEVVNDDRFFELLGVLLDEEAVKAIEIPRQKSFKTIQKELVSFGVSPELLVTSRESKFLIILNDFKH
jgi:hypothetical protein